MKLNKTIMTLILSGMLTLPMIGCGNNTDQQIQEPIQQEQTEDTQNQEIIDDLEYYESVTNEIGEVLNIASEDYTSETLHDAYMWCESKKMEINNYHCNLKTALAKKYLTDAISKTQALIDACTLEVDHGVSVSEYNYNNVVEALQRYSDTCDKIIEEIN